MKIKEALPRIFQKAYPVLDPKTEMLSAISLLQFHDIDALPLSFEPGARPRAILGFSTLARLVLMERKALASFLKLPCEAASEELTTVRADQDLRRLLETFARTRFGFARVEEKRDVGALVGLADILELYDTGVIETDLLAKDVASPIFSMLGETRLKNALREMFSHRYRRLFVSGHQVFISDREIIGYIFSPATLQNILHDSRDVFDITIGELEKSAARKVRPDTTMKDAARALRAERGECLVCEKGVITPWDVIMKPWGKKALKIRKNN